MEGALSLGERRKLGTEITEIITNWAEQRFGKERAFTVTNYVRALARNAALGNGGYMTRLCQSHEEAETVMEAAQDIMEVVDSIRYKTKHGKEE